MTGLLVSIITADNQSVRDRSIEELCAGLTTEDLLAEARRLDRFRKESVNLYHRVRALFFLSAIHRFFLPARLNPSAIGLIPYGGYEHLLQRRYEEAIREFLAAQESQGPSETLSSALAAAYKGLGFQTLADQVRHSVRSLRGNQWMFRVGHELDYPLAIRRELRETSNGVFPVLAERTPVRMDLSHSGWSDIFFLGMDFPEGARVLNISVDLNVRGTLAGTPKPPVEAYLRVIDEPVLRLVSVDLNAQAEISSLAEVFDFARDYLGLLKAAVIASGIIPPGLEGSGRPLSGVLARLTGKQGLGLEIVSKVNDIPKGSRLAVSTNLLACLIAACMRATSQITELTGGLREDERRLVAARAILGEWLGGSGGGWQDSGGVWPGIKLIQGVPAQPGDVEYGVSRGCLLPVHNVMDAGAVSVETRKNLQDSLVLVHGGMAQDVGPVLEMVTEKYLLRSQAEWDGRQTAIRIFDEVVDQLRRGDIPRIGDATQRNFDGPIQTIIPWAANHYTDTLIRSVRSEFGEKFHGFWMLGGMAGGGMGFLFDPSARQAAQERLASIMSRVKAELETAVPFAMEPVVYDFAINGEGTSSRLLHGADALLPAGYYTLVLPKLLRQEARAMPVARRSELYHFAVACQTRPDLAGTSAVLIDHMLPHEQTEQTSGAGSLDRLLDENGFDRIQHEKIRADLRAGRIGLAQNTLRATRRIEDVRPHEITDARTPLPQVLALQGARALRDGALAVLSLAGGAGSRWTRGAGVVKAISPFCKMAGAYRTFVEIHLAKSRRSSRQFDAGIPHIFTTSYMTHDAVRRHLEGCDQYGYEAPLYLSPGQNIGLRLIPMVRDLRFAWEEMPQQVLDEQKQKVRESARGGLIAWAQSMGEGNDYRDNLPSQCLHPVGHWYEVPNLLLNGVLARLLAERPRLRHLLLHNIDTLGAHVDPAIFGAHIESGATLTTEVIPRVVEDRGGGLARVDGRVRLVEGLALPSEKIEFDLSFYNSGTMWIHIDKLLDVFGLTRADLHSRGKVAEAVRLLAARMPAYVTLKDVKKRWGKGQEDIYPVTQFEKLWGDMTALPELDARFVAVPRTRGQQLKEAGQLDGWMRDGSAAAVEALCDWN